jgi:3-hydroxymyristoyl/3-hydroxydecanoyl-(acyl carrier protein) dehydratase
MKTNPRWMPQWHVLSQDNRASEVVLSVLVSDDIEHFEGHFPGLGVLPGVVQIDWAVDCARQFFPIPAQGFYKLEQLKFQALVLPNVTVDLVLSWASEKGRLNFVYRDEKKTYSSGALFWTVGA